MHDRGTDTLTLRRPPPSSTLTQHTQGTCRTNATQPPSLSLGPNNTSDIESQMKHFATNDQMNIFRLPIPWQSLIANTTSPTAPLQLDPPALAQYDRLLQSCLATGAHCIIALLNNPPSQDLTPLWTSLAKTYATTPSIIFELPLPAPSSNLTATLQTSVSAIRTSGATSQLILLPGLAFSSPEEAEATGAALAGITNPDGTTASLLFALRRFLDDDHDNSGPSCTTNNNAAFDTAAKYLRGIGRQAVVSETGVPPGGDGVCLVWFCEQNRFVNGVGDVLVGLVVGGGEGVTPRWEGGRWVDTPVVGNCVVGTWVASVDGSGGGRGIGGVTGGGGRVGVVWWVVGVGLGVGLVGM